MTASVPFVCHSSALDVAGGSIYDKASGKVADRWSISLPFTAERWPLFQPSLDQAPALLHPLIEGL
jgi:hypothetical protein